MGKTVVIGVTGPDRGGFFPWLMTAFAVRRAGARAIRIRPATSQRHQVQLQGLILGGGSDIGPENYGEELRELRRTDERLGLRDRILGLAVFVLRSLFGLKGHRIALDPERDSMETTLCRRALQNGIPVLGICRGAQLLNVVCGGTLHQDTRAFYTERPHMRTLMPRKLVHLKSGSRLAGTLGAENCLVNSLHDQAVDRLGDGMIVSARDENDIVQAVEHATRPFAIGVQWHPEYLPQSGLQQRLFRGLVKAAAVPLENQEQGTT